MASPNPIIVFENEVPVNGNRVFAALSSQNTDQVAYAVTSGYILKVTNLIFSFYNEDISNPGEIAIKDDTILKIPFILPPNSLGNVIPASAGINATFGVRKEFLTDVNVEIVSGTVTYTISFTGYEIPIT